MDWDKSACRNRQHWGMWGSLMRLGPAGDHLGGPFRNFGQENKRSLVISRHAEVAEWLKAAVC